MIHTLPLGDVFKIKGIDAIAHGVNCQGKMGAGIALQIRKKLPEVYDEYKMYCEYYDPPTPGACQRVQTPKYDVFNLFTQDKPGPNAKLDWIRKAVRAMDIIAQGRNMKYVALPAIGSGIGGLDFDFVLEVLEEELGDSPIVYLVVEEHDTLTEWTIESIKDYIITDTLEKIKLDLSKTRLFLEGLYPFNPMK